MALWALIALSSAIFFAAKDILAKKYMNKRITPNQLVFEEYFLLLLLCLILFFPYVDFLSYKLYWDIYILKALSVGLAAFLYFNLLEKNDISVVSPLINLSPLVLIILTSIFLSEVITILQLLGIFIIILATYFLEVTMHHHHRKNPHSHHFSNLISKCNYKFIFKVALMLFVFSTAAIYDRMILLEVNVYTNMFFTAFILFFIYIIYFLKFHRLSLAFEMIRKEPIVLVISIFTIISNFLVLFALAIPTALVSLIIPLRRTSTLFSSLFGGLLFHEKHLKKKIFATLGMLVGVVLIVL